MWTSPCHNGKNGCICNFARGDFDFSVDPQCLVKGHSGIVHSVAFSPDGKRVISGSRDSVKIWDETGAEVNSFGGVS